MASKSDRQGILLYFEIRPALEFLSLEECGTLLHAILNYGENGAEQHFSGVLGAVWAMLKPKLDRDSEAYSERCKQNARNALIPSWKRYAEENGMNAADREARESWIDVQLARDSERKRTEANAGERFPTITITPIQTETITEAITETVTPIQTEVISGASAASTSKKPKDKRFTPPTIEEVAAYCQERGNRLDAGAFVDYYTARGWRIGNQSMKSWQAAVRTWERRDKEAGTGKTGKIVTYHTANEIFDL